MSHISDERKDLYKKRESTMTSSSTIRNMEKDKLEKTPFGQHNYSADSSFRTHDLLKPLPKPQGRSNVSSSLHSMPPLLPNYITGPRHLVNPVPINHTPLIRNTLRSGQHAFQTHIPVGLGVNAAIAPPRIVNSQRSNLPSLKPTNLPNQIQLPINQINLPTIVPPNRAASPRVSTHLLTNENHVDSRGSILPTEQHIRGNVQATHGAQATIQVLSSGSAPSQQAHLPSTFLNKGININSNSSMLKISVSSHSNTNPPTGMSISSFKLGLGKTYPTSTPIIPATTGVTRSEVQEVRHVVGSLPYTRFPVNHNISMPSHIPTQQVSCSTRTQSSITISSIESRPHAVGVPYHPISGAYVFHDMGLHGFHHQLLRPATTSISSLPTFMPIVSIAVSSKGSIQKVVNSQETIRSEGLTIQGSNPFNIQSLYPNIQASNSVVSTTTTSIFESSVRPSILQRKRPADNTSNTSFPVQPTEKERTSSPFKVENGSSCGEPFNPSNVTHEISSENTKNINHSILNLTSDSKLTTPLEVDEIESDIKQSGIASKPSNSLQASLVGSLVNSAITEASPKKKPRKQSIITTEDKYGPVSVPLNNIFNTCSDADEEFLKSNETMKDITPPKSSTSSSHISASLLQATTSNTLHHSFQKQLFPAVSLASPLVKVKQENKEIHLNGMLAPLTSSVAIDPKQNGAMKCYVFRRRPQNGILNNCKVNTKAAHAHFYRHSDVRVKDDKKSSGVPENILTKASIEAASGWKLHHLSDQIHAMMGFEEEIRDEIINIKDELPLPKEMSPLSYHNCVKLSSEDAQLRLIHEVLQGNIQRCNYSMQHLDEAKETMFKVLDHKSKVMEILKSHKLKPRLKKKHS